MSSDLVTLDAGNSRLKLRRWRRTAHRAATVALAACTDFDVVPQADELAEQVLAELAHGAEPERITLCCVASRQIEDALTTALGRRYGAAFVARPEHGLALAADTLASAGRDRLFGARGALELAPRSALVVAAGTCVTVDAVRADANGGGTFLGGAIAPGPRLLARALAQGTARLPEVDPAPGSAALGRDTRAALSAGVVVGFRGAVRELVLAVEREASLAGARIVWTGGARVFLLEPPLFPGRASTEEPELVHLGLLAALGVRVAR